MGIDCATPLVHFTNYWIFPVGILCLILMTCVLRRMKIIGIDAMYFTIRLLILFLCFALLITTSYYMQPYVDQSLYVLGGMFIFAIVFWMYMKYLKRLPKVK